MDGLAGLRAEVLATARQMNACGINRGAAGNVSARVSGRKLEFVITPTGMAYADCTSADMVRLGPDGKLLDQDGRRPSSEWRFHHDIYAARPEAGAVVHTHSPFATALACQELGIPAFHYMIARFGGDSLRCASYATFGTQDLSDQVLLALEGRCACLIAHHGMVVFGQHLRQALDLAVELETLCEQFWRVIQLGEPKLLSADEMQRVLTLFAGYGQQSVIGAT
jgi:L-fuculose-phosphate aldolase